MSEGLEVQLEVISNSQNMLFQGVAVSSGYNFYIFHSKQHNYLT